MSDVLIGVSDILLEKQENKGLQRDRRFSKIYMWCKTHVENIKNSYIQLKKRKKPR